MSIDGSTITPEAIKAARAIRKKYGRLSTYFAQIDRKNKAKQPNWE